jgi:gelsolin
VRHNVIASHPLFVLARHLHKQHVEAFAPLLFKLCDDPEAGPIQVAEAEKIKMGFGPAQPMLKRSLLDEDDVFLLDAGWEIYVWIGKGADRSEKLSAMSKSDAYCRNDPRTADLPLTLLKSGYENNEFSAYFIEE